MVIPAAYGIHIHPLMYSLNQYVFIMRPVENLNHSLLRNMLMYAPEEVVRHLSLCWFFKGLYLATHRIDRAENISYKSVFAAGIHPLQNNQQAVLSLCKQQVLQLRQFLYQFFCLFFNVILIDSDRWCSGERW